jgi:hypothetical protein
MVKINNKVTFPAQIAIGMKKMLFILLIYIRITQLTKVNIRT